jgi:hypothetical protein
MTKTTILSLVVAFTVLASAGCGSAVGDNKSKGKGDKVASTGGEQQQVFVRREGKTGMPEVRQDWRNRPQEEPRPQFVDNSPKSFDGTIKAVDAERRTITLTVGNQDYTLRVDPTANVEEPSLRSYALQGGLSALQPGNHVLVFTTKQDAEDVVGRIKLKAAGNPPQNNNNNNN